MASTYLTRTPSSAGNRKTWTWSAWIKKSTIAVAPAVTLFGAKEGGFPEILYFASDDTLVWQHDISGSDYLLTISNRKFRDVSGWLHIVLTKDTTQSTEANRVKIYINGEQQTLTESQLGFPGQNYEGAVNNNVTHTIGNWEGNSYYFDGSMSHVHFIDGTAYDASAFGETDATTGEWKINTSPSVTYGTNGFFILKDGNSVTDQSGNSNNFTVSGGTLTKTEDCPSNVFACWSSIQSRSSDFTFANGNSTFSLGGISRGGISTLGDSVGKYYYEAKCSSGTFFQLGAVKSSYAWNNDDVWSGKTGAVVYKENGNIYKDGVSVSSAFSSISSGDIVMIAIDLDNNYMYFGKNGTWGNSGDPTSGATGTGGISISADEYLFAGSGASNTIQGNFGNGYFGTTAVATEGTNASGNGIFEYDVPTGYTALSTKGLNL